MIKFLIKYFIIAFLFFVFINFIDGFNLEPFKELNFNITNDDGFYLAFFALVTIYFLLDLILFPILNLLTIPLRILTLGLSSIFLSVGLLYLIPLFYINFSIDSHLIAVSLGIIFGLVRKATR